MDSIPWIKLWLNIFTHPKIIWLRSQPSGDTLVLIWFALLVLAGKCNDGGLVYLVPNVPYTPEELGALLSCDPETIRHGLTAFEHLNMISVDDQGIYILGWSEYQNTDSLEQHRKKNRERQRSYRARAKANRNVTRNVTSRDSNVQELEEDEEVETEQKDMSSPSAAAPGKPARHQYGNYKNVLLTDDELDKLRSEFPPDWGERIERLSEYIASSGKRYKSHLATIRAWARKERDAASGGKRFNIRHGSDDDVDLDDLF